MNSRDDILLDDSLWPLLIVRFVGVPTPPQMEAFLTRMTAILERGEPYVSLFDASGMTGVGSTELRHLYVAWMKRHAVRQRELNRGTASVVTSPLIRLTLNVVLHLTPQRSPYLITARLDEAAAWVADRLEQSGQGPAARRVREHFGPRDGR
jgi:hypothetical protein